MMMLHEFLLHMILHMMQFCLMMISNLYLLQFLFLGKLSFCISSIDIRVMIHLMIRLMIRLMNMIGSLLQHIQLLIHIVLFSIGILILSMFGMISMIHVIHGSCMTIYCHMWKVKI
mmetsp:Transcript_98379/g.234203  ORF Transcript_98379/g.234203 Transcript_98379/m.234203 type:complete len:116 (-) Transcript_98379:180-527(-)